MIRGRIVAAWLLAATSALAVACSPRYDSVELRRVAGHPAARVSDREITVPEGGLVVIEADALSAAGSRDYEAIDAMELFSGNSDRVRVVQGLRVDTWMVLGVSQGDTEVLVRLNDRVEDGIPVRVTPQEVTP
ncbi:MAG: hypothetical protein K0V04_33415 [Deltaproteobacteria bacterium]|nr:hypothetical protein [Deltaproteobacteria bacterium]